LTKLSRRSQVRILASTLRTRVLARSAIERGRERERRALGRCLKAATTQRSAMCLPTGETAEAICGRRSELNGYSQRQGSPLSKHELTSPTTRRRAVNASRGDAKRRQRKRPMRVVLIECQSIIYYIYEAALTRGAFQYYPGNPFSSRLRSLPDSPRHLDITGNSGTIVRSFASAVN